jgi:hypothetical protein
MLNALSQSTIKPLHSFFPPHLLSTTSADPCYTYMLLKRMKLIRSLVKMLLVLGVRYTQSTACDVWSLHFQDKA